MHLSLRKGWRLATGVSLIRSSRFYPSKANGRAKLTIWLSQAEQLISVPYKLQAQDELKRTKNLEYTIFHTGYFSDYWGMPVVKSNMAPMTAVIDIAHNAAAIPGSGNVPVIFTHTTDVAKYVAASLDLDTWDPEFFIIGDRLTWNEFLQLAEDAKGIFCPEQ